MSAKKILIVDDDRDWVLGLAICLKSWGYAVTTAGDAVAALSVAVNDAPDLVLLDLGLPAGDGFVVMERMRSLTPLATIPIIVIAARDIITNAERARTGGAFARFQKPVDNAALRGAVRRALREETSEAQW